MNPATTASTSSSSQHRASASAPCSLSAAWRCRLATRRSPPQEPQPEQPNPQPETATRHTTKTASLLDSHRDHLTATPTLTPDPPQTRWSKPALNGHERRAREAMTDREAKLHKEIAQLNARVNELREERDNYRTANEVFARALHALTVENDTLRRNTNRSRTAHLTAIDPNAAIRLTNGHPGPTAASPVEESARPRPTDGTAKPRAWPPASPRRRRNSRASTEQRAIIHQRRIWDCQRQDRTSLAPEAPTRLRHNIGSWTGRSSALSDCWARDSTVVAEDAKAELISIRGPRRRGTLQQAQAVARHRHMIRQDCPLLPRRTSPWSQRSSGHDDWFQGAPGAGRWALFVL